MRLMPFMLLLPLAACASVVPPPPVVGGPVGICRGDALPSFVGQAATSELGSRMLAATGARTLRWVARGMMVTMEYSEQRLTVYLDGTNRVERAGCG